MSVRPGAPKHFAAAYLRKTQVKKNQVRSRMAEHIESGFSIVRHCDIQRDGAILQEFSNEQDIGFVIFDYQKFNRNHLNLRYANS